MAIEFYVFSNTKIDKDSCMNLVQSPSQTSQQEIQFVYDCKERSGFSQNYVFM